MQKSERIVSYTKDELEAMIARGETLSDWAYVDSLTEEELEASIDYEDEGCFDPDNGVVWPAHPRPDAIGVDDDVHAWFKERGGDVEGIMNAVLRRWMVARLPELKGGLSQVAASPQARTGEAA